MIHRRPHHPAHHPRRRRPLALDRALRALRRHAHDRARRHGRERCAALDPGGPRVLAVEPRLGRQRLPHRLRRAAAAGRPARRSHLAARRVPRRPGDLHARLDRLRHGAEPGDARRGALRAGRRRRDDLRRDPRDDRHDVPRAARAGEGDRRLRLRRLRRRLDRPARRRRADAVDQLALDLLREHPDRDHHRRPGDAPAREGQGHRPRQRRRRARRGARHLGAHAARLHDRRPRGRARLGRGAHARALRRSRSRCSPRSSSREATREDPAHPAADLPLAQRLGREPHPGRVGRRHVLDVLHGLAVHAARARLRRPADRPGLPARHDHHGRPVARLLAQARHAATAPAR